MKRLVSCSVSLALAGVLVAAPISNAAEIGKLDEVTDTCKVRLNDAELEKARAFQTSVTERDMQNLMLEGLESAYPFFKTEIDSLFEDVDVQALIRAKRDSRDLSFEQSEAALEKIEAAVRKHEGKDYFDTFAGYAEARLLIAADSGADAGNFDPWSVLEISEVHADAEFFEVESFDELLEMLGRAAFDLPNHKLNAFKNGALRSKAGKALRHDGDAYFNAMSKAQRACAAGGKTTVDFPVKSQGKKSEVGGTSSDNLGKTLGIVFGVLAAVGLLVGGVVALAPQLGIKLPV